MHLVISEGVPTFSISLCERDSTFKNRSAWGNVFYSKYPIDSLALLSISLKNSQPFVTVNLDDQKIYLLGCHLSSNNYVASNVKMELDDVSNKEDAFNYYKSIKKGYNSRGRDVDSICSQLYGTDKFQLIILGDMNDVSGSYSICQLESLGLQDAWWNGGFGIGGTRSVLGFPFRIDHILYGEHLELKEVRKIDANGLSDHDALSARFGIKKY